MTGDMTAWVATLAIGALALTFLKVWIDERFDAADQARDDLEWHRLTRTVDEARRGLR